MRRSSTPNPKQPSPCVAPSANCYLLYLIPLNTFTTGSYRIWMNSLDVASANQGPFSLNRVRWREWMEGRGGVIDLKGLWHFWARLFLIRATCFIHNPMGTLLLSKHTPHLLRTMFRAHTGANVRAVIWFWGSLEMTKSTAGWNCCLWLEFSVTISSCGCKILQAGCLGRPWEVAWFCSQHTLDIHQFKKMFTSKIFNVSDLI